jgi:chromosome segregation protein
VFLRSLTLKGFKSFADPTTLELEPGLTVVVGPNGSGKSNIVDSVAWVLGAQGPRTVRSSRMEDVIFAGNGRRPPLGRAEVALTIDNSAGLLPIGFSEVTITRTLFRSSGESEYAINGVPCRLLDVQELLSDTGVGRLQHVIVSQGNLDQVLDVRPEERRLIVEEAAGILKFRRRKEKAARRLEATETHFVRLTDLLRELRRQMRPLERQAEAARRHAELAGELRALRLYLAGRSLAALQARAEAATRDRANLTAEEAGAHGEVRRLDAAVTALETRLGTMAAGGLDEVLARSDALSERARGLAAVLAERSRSLAVEVASADAPDGDDEVTRLEAEGAVLTIDLAAADEQATRLLAAFDELAAAESELDSRRQVLARREAAEQAARQAAEARGELSALRAAADRSRAEVAELERLAAAAHEAAAGEAQRVAVARAGLDAAEAGWAEAASATDSASRHRATTQEAAAAAAERARAAEGRRDASAARVEALTLALGGSDVAGLGVPEDAARPLLEAVEIEPGWEAAVEAALGEALSGLVVDDAEVARTILSGGPAAAGAAPLLVARLAAPVLLSARGLFGEPLRPRVMSERPEVGAVLDRLLARALVVDGDWETALDVALTRPDLVVVTRQGDRFAPTGWRLARPESVAQALAEAKRESERAATEAAAALADEAATREAAERAAAAASAAEEHRAAAEHDMNVHRAELALVEADYREAAASATAAARHLAATRAQQEADQGRANMLEVRLGETPAGEDAALLSGGDLPTERRLVSETAENVAARRAELETTADAVRRQRDDLLRRLGDVETRLTAARDRRAGAEERATEARVQLQVLGRLSTALAASRAEIERRRTDCANQRDRRMAARTAVVERLERLRHDRSDAERRLEDARARARRAELEDAEARMRLEAAVETLRRDLEFEPDVAVASECPELPAGTSAPTRARDLERELRLLGPVNPLAVEELAALEERHTFLSEQLEDVKASRRDLAKIIRSVEAEMTDLLAAAYADVAENFSALFHTLFPGGEGSLRLTDPHDVLESGIDIDARPGGKSARKLSLLSGGERSLCALAFLFAVFRSRPSPFYLLDEVEAALDDVNLHRFLRLLDEFRPDAQLLVVTHQKRTMEAADCLFGVTIQPGGTSRVLSERVRVAN